MSPHRAAARQGRPRTIAVFRAQPLHEASSPSWDCMGYCGSQREIKESEWRKVGTVENGAVPRHGARVRRCTGCLGKNPGCARTPRLGTRCGRPCRSTPAPSEGAEGEPLDRSGPVFEEVFAVRSPPSRRLSPTKGSARTSLNHFHRPSVAQRSLRRTIEALRRRPRADEHAKCMRRAPGGDNFPATLPLSRVRREAGGGQRENSRLIQVDSVDARAGRIEPEAKSERPSRGLSPRFTPCSLRASGCPLS